VYTQVHGGGHGDGAVDVGVWMPDAAAGRRSTTVSCGPPLKPIRFKIIASRTDRGEIQNMRPIRPESATAGFHYCRVYRLITQWLGKART